MNNQKNSLLIAGLGGAVIAIIVIAGGLFVYFQFIKTSETADDNVKGSVADNSAAGYQIPMGVTVPNDTATETQDPTADWLSFTLPNPAVKLAATSSTTSTLFSFKYPKEFQLRQNKSNITLSSVLTTSTQIAVNWEVTTKNLATYLKDLDKVNAKSWEGQPSVKVVTSTDQAAISSLPAVVREQKLLAADLSEYVVYFKSSSTVYSLSVVAPALSQELLNLLVVFIDNFKLGN